MAAESRSQNFLSFLVINYNICWHIGKIIADRTYENWRPNENLGGEMVGRGGVDSEFACRQPMLSDGPKDRGMKTQVKGDQTTVRVRGLSSQKRGEVKDLTSSVLVLDSCS